MAQVSVPRFHNDPGVSSIAIGTREFMCQGASAPFDHPHVFLDMGDGVEIVCPYCSTLFKFDHRLDASQAQPAACALAG